MKSASKFDPAAATRALSGPGADIAAGLLGEIQDLSSRTEYDAASERAAGAIQDGGTDIRALSPFLLGVFLERGPESLPIVLGILRSALSDRWSAVRPEARKTRVVDSALSWLFRAIVVQIDFHTKMEDATFRGWAGANSTTVGHPSLEASSALRAAIAAVIVDERSTVQLSELTVRVQAQFNRIEAALPVAVATREPPPEKEVQEKQPDDEDDEAQEEDAESEGMSPGHFWGPEPTLIAPSATAPTLEISPAMEIFLRKLAAFEALVARGDLERAAVVAEDVRSTLESFDPRVYFPRLLASYARVLATHVNDIAPHWESIGSPPWRALEQLYRVDLDAFLAR